MICEEELTKEKKMFGRVRKYKMRYLRERYGEDTANRALWRISRRKSGGYFKAKQNSTRLLKNSFRDAEIY